MGKALYRKYRSKNLDEIVGQKPITQTLKKAIESGKISHAYLFTGPRGVGKTSIARILAHQINDIEYKDDSLHLDIIEIDAASNRRIDEIRDLRDRVSIAPTVAKYKIYIIDEVHMLTTYAFNALLKTLEEPPAHVIFILATTDVHKLPDTIISRTQRFNFRPVQTVEIANHLKFIASEENITISDEALTLLAEHGEGSFRDSIGLLDQLASSGISIDAELVYNLLGLPPQNSVQTLADTLINSSDILLVAQQINELYAQGFQADAIAKQLSKYLRKDLLSTTRKYTAEKSLKIMNLLLDVPSAYNPEKSLEIILLDYMINNTSENKNIKRAPTSNEKNNETSVIPLKTAKIDKDQKKITRQTDNDKKESQNFVSNSSSPVNRTLNAHDDEVVLKDLWPQLLDALKHKYNTLYGVVRMAHPSFNDEHTLTLTFAFAFHQKRINDIKNRVILAELIKKITGQTIDIKCLVDKEILTKNNSHDTPIVNDAPPEDIAIISSIFGGGEVID